MSLSKACLLQGGLHPLTELASLPLAGSPSQGQSVTEDSVPHTQNKGFHPSVDKIIVLVEMYLEDQVSQACHILVT